MARCLNQEICTLEPVKILSEIHYVHAFIHISYWNAFKTLRYTFTVFTDSSPPKYVISMKEGRKKEDKKNKKYTDITKLGTVSWL